MRAKAPLLVLALAGCSPPGAGSETTETAGTSSTTEAGSTAATSAADPTTGEPAPTSSGDTPVTDSDASVTGDAGTTADPGTTGDASTTGGDVLPCNGHVELCARPYDEVVFPMTHNSFAATEEGFGLFNANQIRPVAAQLADGVRGLMLDVEMDGDSVILCHGPCLLGELVHLDVLADIADFLAANPREVITIIYQDSAPVDAIVADLAAVGLDQLAFTYAGGPFPTLGEMIAADTRLVVTAESGGPPPAWFHHVWDVAWDTPYSFNDPSEFSCELNRGDKSNPLFLLNHWVSTDLGLPSEGDAMDVNQFEVLHARAAQCMQEAGDVTNFVAVDFYEHGDLFEVVDALNGL